MDRARVAGLRGIVFTDMVGSTVLRSQLGDDHADDLRRAHDALLGSAVAAHGGQVTRWTGDGCKAAFPTASAAVAAAIDMQRAVRRYGLTVDAVAAFEIRIGVSVGEVTYDDTDDDAHGVAAVEAARLEAMAAPGEILATDLVQRLGQRRVDAAFEEVGSHALKGLDRPVDIVRIVDTALAAGSRPVPRALALDRRFPLVGRSDELAVATRCWATVRAGSAATLLVAGQPGIGKSRFVAQIADHAHAGGAVVLAGVCDADLAVPYQPFATAFSEDRAIDNELSEAVSEGTGPLGPLFPARRVGRFDDAGPSARFELFEAVVALIERIARDQPVVFVLEDMQWATPATVQLFRHLIHAPIAARLLLLASYRAEDLGPAHPLQDLLVETRTSDGVSRLELDALREQEVVELVATRAPNAPLEHVRAFSRRMWDESGGSPFFVCEVLHHLFATGGLEQLVGDGNASQLPIPDSVRDVVGQRVARLPADAGELLSTAAAVGLTFDLELLAAVAGRSVEDVLGALEGATAVALVHELAAGRFSFAHGIVRGTLLERMSETRRALAHRRIAEAIEALRPADHDELAHHWLLAGAEEKANANVELAARRDLEALAYESAAERYQAILDYHRTSGTGDVAMTARAWLGLGLARRAVGEADFINAIKEAGRLGRKLRDVDIVVEAAIASILPGTYFVTPGSTQTGLVELGEDALQLIDPADPRRARVLSTLAAHLTFDDDRDRRVALLNEALELARGDGDPELIGSVLTAEYLALWDPTTFARRAEIARDVSRMARASGDNDLEFFAGFFAAIGSVERAEVAEARTRLDELLALDGPIVASRNFYFGFLAERLRVSLDVLTGSPDVQARIDALAEKYAGTHADTTGTWALQTGGIAYQTGALGTLAPALQTLLEESAVAGNWKAPYGLALLDNGDHAGATAVLDELEEPPLDFFWLTAMQSVSELAIGLARADMVPQLFERLAPYREQLGITASGSLCFGLVATTLGQLALFMGEHAVAIELLEGAVARADAMRAPFEQVKCRRLLAQTLIATARPVADVEPMLEAAVPLAAQHGFLGEQALLSELAVGAVE